MRSTPEAPVWTLSLSLWGSVSVCGFDSKVLVEICEASGTDGRRAQLSQPVTHTDRERAFAFVRILLFVRELFRLRTDHKAAFWSRLSRFYP